MARFPGANRSVVPFLYRPPRSKRSWRPVGAVRGNLLGRMVARGAPAYRRNAYSGNLFNFMARRRYNNRYLLRRSIFGPRR